MVGKPRENEGNQYIYIMVFYQVHQYCLRSSIDWRKITLNSPLEANFCQRTTVIILLESIKPIYNPITLNPDRPRWLSWVRRPTGVAGSTSAEVGNIL